MHIVAFIFLFETATVASIRIFFNRDYAHDHYSDHALPLR